MRNRYVKKRIVFIFSVLGLVILIFFFGFYSGFERKLAYYPVKTLVRKARKVRTKTLYMLGLKEKGCWSHGSFHPSYSFPDSEDRKKLASLPYVQGKVKAPEFSSVIVNNTGKAYAGLNFFISGHKPCAYLMDMNGKIIHEWSLGFDQVWPEGLEFYEHEFHKTFWRRAYLYPNGDLLVIFEGIGIVKLDKNSQIIWKNKCRAHHDLFVNTDGDIYTLSRKKHRPKYESEFSVELEGPIWEDFVLILSSDGKVKDKISIYKCILDSDYAPILDLGIKEGHILHTNTIEVLDGEQEDLMPIFKKGHILVSMRTINTVAVIDPELKKVTWDMYGMWKMQHQPTILENGNLLLFDNIGGFRMSKVIEINPITQKIEWEYKGTKEHPFYSSTCGSNQRLPNGNTLITESDYGRAFEVTPAGELVWEYLNPFRAGKKDELIATLFEMIRIEPDQVKFSPSFSSECFK
jgi:hypothetical protein